MRVDVLWTGRELTTAQIQGHTVVVIDVLRACSTILTALTAGASKAIACATPADAERAAREIGREQALLCGEQGGLPIEGFDLGNSPLEYERGTVEGRTLVVSTTNGSPAMNASQSADHLFLACFRNVGAAAREVLTAGAPVSIVCAGRGGLVSLDDALCAGLMVRRLAGSAESLDISDGAAAAAHLADACGHPTPAWLAETEAGATLVRVGYGEDLRFCGELDVETGVPVWRPGGFELPTEVVDGC